MTTMAMATTMTMATTVTVATTMTTSAVTTTMTRIWLCLGHSAANDRDEKQ